MSTRLQQKITELDMLIEPVINELLTKDVDSENAQMMTYQCSVGGKRIRPVLVILSGQVFGASVDSLIYPAASAEILHNATLIIDDIIDHSEFRRDQPTCWKKYGVSVSICAAFSYSSSIFYGLNHVDNNSRLAQLYSKAIKVVVDGEIKDMLFERSGRDDEVFIKTNRYKVVTVDDYFEMINQKTASLLQTCCQAGAICAGASEKQVNDIGEFSLNLGMAFQIRDDILDIFGDEKKLGKKIGKDIIEKKMGNLLILSAIEQLDDVDKKSVLEILEDDGDVSGDDVKKVTALIEKAKARKIAEEFADRYTRAAYDALKKLPQNEHTELLKDMVQYIVARKR